MLDIKFLRENPEIVKENIKKKFQDAKLPLVDEAIEIDKKSIEDMDYFLKENKELLEFYIKYKQLEIANEKLIKAYPEVENLNFQK